MVRRVRDGGGVEIKALLSYRGYMEALIKNVAITSGDRRHMDIERRARLRIKLPNVVCVDAKGLLLKDDRLHLTIHAQVCLGHMMADTCLWHFAP
ncbi:probable carbohydrate esterase At4g34215 [Eucalyptus grandis]|uniref:probable carbohydrate esterase At4g34215 n=1 Tax=Eucalyptus grandis TaxID=71139 RepID=UPI00192ECB4B|nr:probable carbohydrate esterase At4g34215 [Eucalyptus grandis]